MALVESQVGGGVIAAPPVAEKGRREGWLFSPLVDFLCLGGGSMLALPLLLLVPADGATRNTFAWWALYLAYVVNHPHFAHSYQIFYSGFRGKAFGNTFEPNLRLRYVIAGIVVPIALLAYLLTTIVVGSPAALGIAGNAMFFLVGWHYVKQGYGMAMLDATLKKRFYAPVEKKILLWNGYSCWFLSWLLANITVFKYDYWGLAYYSFAAPPWLLLSAKIAAGLTSAAALGMVLLKARKTGWRMPWNGLLGYAASLYVWLIVANTSPLFVLVVPAFHSLQYLVVVWRYQANRTKAAPDYRDRPLRWLPAIGALRYVFFLMLGVLFGWLGFWAVPEWLNGAVPYDKGLFGPTVFLFVFWIFINIHHYFLDNVMWRRENPETRRFLFGAK